MLVDDDFDFDRAYAEWSHTWDDRRRSVPESEYACLVYSERGQQFRVPLVEFVASHGFAGHEYRVEHSWTDRSAMIYIRLCGEERDCARCRSIRGQPRREAGCWPL